MSNAEIHNTPNILLLAAGLSLRMGETNKLLMPHKGRPLIRHSAEFFCRHFSKVYIVTGFEADKLKAACAGLDVSFIHNPDFERGLESSFAAGLQALDAAAPLLTALGDQIFLGRSDIDAVQHAYKDNGAEMIIIPQYQGQRGHPIMFPPAAVAAMTAARPPMSGRAYIKSHPESVYYAEMTQPHCILDIDTPQDAVQHLRPYEISDDAT